MARHKVRHVRHIAPRAYDEGYRESYGYAYEPQVTTGNYDGVNGLPIYNGVNRFPGVW